ncbi:sodium:proton antiporter [Flammeovirga yaeyamensis]|uniref:Sodium:proton antiporter n=2 Tax=Flammeovirga yaeyamensis TaxID=367791 RepID=A0AAX1N4N4_9BACT|nr:sodium:proton antiporter [Flammeovirga yaeyamensis]MBB3700388.1 Na+/H+ antiporter NhaD/arsenite permease-like protein [Flammeovirga yaeyamensis]NMF36986.1 citrate transporter [Flammeovirga yaeyamensis]QWG02470.1 sodium:proton antiporter [Flammeovirga yaeyamensis]
MKKKILLLFVMLGLGLTVGVSPVFASGGGHPEAAPWSVIPFAALLIMIATGPLFYEKFWHHNYPKVAVGLAAIVVGYYIFGLHNTHGPIHAFFEYFQFIALLSGLYIASGGIMINVDRKGTPLANTILLVFGAVISNIIGTTGASMLLIRPFMRLNQERIQPYHVVFFIFIVSNVGGALTPIGDPPLFLGFLKGVPFEWTLIHSVPMWAFTIAMLAVVFFFFDRRFVNKKNLLFDEETEKTYSNKITITGAKNFAWLAVLVAAVFFDPSKISWLPGILQTHEGMSIGFLSDLQHHEGATLFSFIREIIMLSVAYLSYKFADQKAIKGNEFNFEPIREVAFIFIGIFGTMMPALELVGGFAASDAGAPLITHNTLYWATGSLSGILDNAPTYLNFLTAAMASKGADINSAQQVLDFTNGIVNGAPNHEAQLELLAISVAAVFFGAMTYIGNGPNFMVKSIAEQSGVEMPSFFGYILRYSLPILFSILIVVWLVFFAFV